MKKVVIAYCHYGIVHEPFADCLMNLLAYEWERKAHIIKRASAKGAYIADSRNILVGEFLKTDAQWMLFLDIDMIFAPNLLHVLMDNAGDDRKIVAGFYLTQFRKGEQHGICSTWSVIGEDGRLSTVGEIKPRSIAEVATVGMGGTLIHRCVFEAISESRSGMAADAWEWFGHDLIDGERHGEDMTFCLRAKAAGFASYGCTSAALGHIKPKVLDIGSLTPR